MKNLHELYTLLYQQIQFQENIGGICHYIEHLFDSGKITRTERKLLRSDFDSQYPRSSFYFFGVNKEFTHHKCFIKNNRSAYWWKGEGATEQRKLFLLHLIEKTKKSS